MTSPAPTSPPPTTGAGADVSGATASLGSASVGSEVTSKVSIGDVEPEAVQALQNALASAHAAIWTYGLINAYDSDDTSLIRTDRLAYVTLRDTTTDLLRSVGAEPVLPEAAYKPPLEVVDRPSAVQLSIAVEKDVTNTWRAVVGSTDNVELRKYALLALAAAAVRLTQWRQLAGVTPITVPFPGDEA